VDSGDAIEVAVEGHDSANRIALHDGDMDRIARREGRHAEHQVARREDILLLDRKDLVDRPEERIEARLNRAVAIDRRIPMQDLLEYLLRTAPAFAYSCHECD